MVVFTTLMHPATYEDRMLYFEQFDHSIDELGSRKKRSLEEIDKRLREIEEGGEVRFHYSFYLGWFSCLILVIVTIFNCTIYNRKKYEDASISALH